MKLEILLIIFAAIYFLGIFIHLRRKKKLSQNVDTVFEPSNFTDVHADETGKIVKIVENIGAKVKDGDCIAVIETLKMEIPVLAPRKGILTNIYVKVGDTVKEDTLIATLK